MSKFTIREITKKNVKRLSDSFWKKYFDMRIQFDERPGTKAPYVTWEQAKETITNTFIKDKNFHSICIIKNGDMFYGYVTFTSLLNSQRNNYLEVFYNSIHLDADKEMVSLISNQIRKYFNKERDGMILFLTNNNKFGNIAAELKGKIGDHTVRMKLPPKEANKKEMRKWMKELPEKNPDIKLKFYTTLPQKLIKEYSALFTKLMEDMPGPHYFNTFVDPKKMAEGEKKNKNSDNQSYRMLAFNKKNKLIGMTNIYINKKHPQYPYQYMTGTMPEYRHRGIAKWMKAENFFRITGDFKNRITAIVTETSPNNYGSKRTSKLLGFKYEGCDVLYELDIDKL